MWCFAFSHTSTFELIPSVATAQPGAVVTIRTVNVETSIRHECDRQTNTIVHMLYRHNDVKNKGRWGARERERERERQTDRQTHTGDIVCMNVTDR